MHELNYFVSCICENKRPSVITPEEAAQAVRVMEAAEESAIVGRPIEIA